MGITVGMPTMFLGRKEGKQGKRTGNAKAILCEALKERWTSDPDYNPDRTQDNIYLTDITSGLELYQKWKDRADSYVQVQKNGRQRKLRDDAHIGFAGICKPSGESEYGNYTEQQQIQFCRDSFSVLQQVYAKYGVTLDYGVIQVDEGNVHLHYGGSDADFRLAKRIGLKLFNDLNKGDYVRLMREKGWNVQPLDGYDPQKAAEMTPEQLEEYKQEQIERKKSRKSGKSSRQYKAEQERKKAQEIQAENERQQEQLQREQEQLQANQRKLQSEQQHLQSDREQMEKEQQERADEFQHKEDKLEAQKRALDEQQKQLDERRERYYTPPVIGEKVPFGKAKQVVQAKNEQIAYLQTKSEIRDLTTADIKAARQARSDAERLRDAAAAELTAAQRERQAAQAEKEKYERLKQQEEKTIQQEVEKRVPDAAAKKYNFDAAVMRDFIARDPKRQEVYNRYHAYRVEQRQNSVQQMTRDIQQMQDDKQYD